jgi:tetratricopeptide (TPR) repeat protein
MPIIPILIVFASYGIFSFFKSKNKKKNVLPIALFLSLFIFFNTNLYRITDPNLYLTSFQTAQISFSEGKYRSALHEIDLSISKDSTFAESRNLRGLILKSLNRSQEAEQEFLKAINLDSTMPDPYINLGNIYAGRGNLHWAELYFTKAIEIDSNAAVAFNNLGNIFFQKGHYDDAIKHYNFAIKRDSNYTSPLFHIGLIHYKLNNSAKAESVWKKVLEIEPGHRDAQRALKAFIK